MIPYIIYCIDLRKIESRVEYQRKVNYDKEKRTRLVS